VCVGAASLGLGRSVAETRGHFSVSGRGKERRGNLGGWGGAGWGDGGRREGRERAGVRFLLRSNSRRPPAWHSHAGRIRSACWQARWLSAMSAAGAGACDRQKAGQAGRVPPPRLPAPRAGRRRGEGEREGERAARARERLLHPPTSRAQGCVRGNGLGGRPGRTGVREGRGHTHTRLRPLSSPPRPPPRVSPNLLCPTPLAPRRTRSFFPRRRKGGAAEKTRRPCAPAHAHNSRPLRPSPAGPGASERQAAPAGALSPPAHTRGAKCQTPSSPPSPARTTAWAGRAGRPRAPCLRRRPPLARPTFRCVCVCEGGWRAGCG
jgi:hypothetical protein